MENALNLPPSDGSRIPRGQLLHLLAQASTLKMESLWRGRDELPGEFMADLIFRVKPARSEPLSHSTLPYVVFSPNKQFERRFQYTLTTLDPTQVRLSGRCPCESQSRSTSSTWKKSFEQYVLSLSQGHFYFLTTYTRTKHRY